VAMREYYKEMEPQQRGVEKGETGWSVTIVKSDSLLPSLIGNSLKSPAR